MNSLRKRILLISHYLGVTGAPNSLLRHAKYLLEAGHNVDVWSLADGALRERYEGVGLKPQIVKDDFDAIREAVDRTQIKYDLIICNTVVTWRCVKVFCELGMPVVWFVRETCWLDKWYLQKPDFASVFCRFDRLYCPSKYAASVIRMYNRRVEIINNSVEDVFADFDPLQDKRVRFGYIGSIITNKGVDLLLSAFVKVADCKVGCELYIAGGKRSALSKMMLARYADRKDIHWLGEVQGDDKENFFRNIDVLCVLSLDEPSGLSLTEGAMHGKALITTKRVGAKYVAENGAGFILRPGSEEALRKAIEDIVRMPKSRLREAQKVARDNYLKFSVPSIERSEVLKMVDRYVGQRNSVGQSAALEFIQRTGMLPRILRYGRRKLLSLVLLLLSRGPWSKMGRYE